MNTIDTPTDVPLILIVEDDRFMRIQLRHAMEQVGYRVAEAGDGEEGLAAYTRLQPDLVLLDALMPVMDGFTCCAEIQALPGSDRTPILMITSLEDQESVDRAFAVGAVDYVTKPIHWAVLRQRVRRLLEASRAVQELQRQNLRAQLFAEVTLKIRQSLHIEEILQTTVTEVQRILSSDRVLIFQLWPQGFGKIVTEAVADNCTSILGRNVTDGYLTSEYLSRYHQGRVYTLTDIQTAEVPCCFQEFMQQFGIQSKVAVPILLQDKLWGLLVAHQCTSPRQWTNFETELLSQLADQIGIALAQAQLLEQETRQRQELARSNAELEKFAHVASHDLQEPLRKIIAFGDRLKAKYSEALPGQGYDYLDRMQNAAQRMQALINDLLMLSRITTKAQPFVLVNLNDVVRDVLSDLELRIEQTQGQIEVGELPTVEADPLQMHQLLQNLISNALKFHPKDKPPQIKIDSQLFHVKLQQSNTNSTLPTHCQIRLEDNGIGFDEKYVESIFNAFHRLHPRTEYEGTGMGLAICRKIVERHNGNITAKSVLGQGSTFIVILPLPQPQLKSEGYSFEV
jgi:light-regulated signal transduction histidine kinase (bacteriophytochrome)